MHTATSRERPVPIPQGTIVYDVITDGYGIALDKQAENRQLAECRPAEQELIEQSYGNQLLGVSSESLVTTIAYLNVTSAATRTYLMPLERLVRPDIDRATGGQSHRELVHEAFVEELFFAASKLPLPAAAVDSEAAATRRGLYQWLGECCAAAGVKTEIVDEMVSMYEPTE